MGGASLESETGAQQVANPGETGRGLHAVVATASFFGPRSTSTI
jgi:hypothetical protein